MFEGRIVQWDHGTGLPLFTSATRTRLTTSGMPNTNSTRISILSNAFADFSQPGSPLYTPDFDIVKAIQSADTVWC